MMDGVFSGLFLLSQLCSTVLETFVKAGTEWLKVLMRPFERTWVVPPGPVDQSPLRWTDSIRFSVGIAADLQGLFLFTVRNNEKHWCEVKSAGGASMLMWTTYSGHVLLRCPAPLSFFPFVLHRHTIVKNNQTRPLCPDGICMWTRDERNEPKHMSTGSTFWKQSSDAQEAIVFHSVSDVMERTLLSTWWLTHFLCIPMKLQVSQQHLRQQPRGLYPQG